VSTVQKYDGVICALFDNLFDCVNGFVSVQKIALLLNAKTRRKDLLEAKFRRMKILKTIVMQDPNFEFDPSCISVYDVQFDYKRTGPKDKHTGEPIVEKEDKDMEGYNVNTCVGPFTMVVEQGQIICVRAGSSTGKKTFIQLLGRILLPNVSGIIIYPDNLRVRYIPGEPLLFAKDLLYNLKFGNQKPVAEEDMWETCKLLGLTEELLYKPKFKVGQNGKKLSLSDRIYINLARALLSSVDLLLMSNSLDLLGPSDARRVMDLLNGWIDYRGLKCCKHDRPAGCDPSLLKKKTLFYVSKNEQLEQLAHATLNLHGRNQPKGKGKKKGRESNPH